MISILITGFEPFNGGMRNPSEDVVRAIAETHRNDSLIAEILPVEFDAAHRRLEQLLQRYQPRAWIGFGLNQRASAIMLERAAVNLDDATIPDNAGELRRGQPIDSQGAETYRSTLPLESIAAELRLRNIPVEFSDSAGRFVCNHLFYRAMCILGRSHPSSLGGFIHIPWPCNWDLATASRHTVTLATVVDAGQVCITTILRELRTQNSAVP